MAKATFFLRRKLKKNGFLRKVYADYVIPIRIRHKPKIFCIGMNKTGTNSLTKAMQELGLTVAHPHKRDVLFKQWAKRDFYPLIRFCRKAEFFHDAPISLPYTYIILDHAFPGSKFILTIRDSPEQWYRSITRFHAKKWGKDGRIPTKEDLQNAEHHYKGAAWEANRLLYMTPENDPYEKQELTARYITHNKQVLDYFRHRPDDLLVLNVAEDEAYEKLCRFLGKKPEKKDFP